MSEFEICDTNWTKMSRPAWTSITATKSGNSWEWIDKLIDWSISTKYCTPYAPPITITIDLWTTVDFSTYCKYKRYTANDSYPRDPITWTISLSNDGSNWTEVSNISNATITTARNTLAWTWDITIPTPPSYKQIRKVYLWSTQVRPNIWWERPDITSFSYTSSATTSKSQAHAFCCTHNWQYAYIIDGDWPVYEYSLSDSTLSTLTYVTSKSWIKSRWAYVKDDWTVLYSCIDWSPYTYTATMGTPYNISTASSTTHSLPSNTAPTWWEFSADWVYFYCSSWWDAHSIYQYTCSTPRDLSTATLTRTKDLSANLNNRALYCERFSPTWLKLYVSVRSGSEVHQFNLSTAWDVSTVSYFWTLTLSTSYGWDGYGIWFCNNWTRLFAHTITNYNWAVWTMLQYDI